MPVFCRRSLLVTPIPNDFRLRHVNKEVRAVTCSSLLLRHFEACGVLQVIVKIVIFYKRCSNRVGVNVFKKISLKHNVNPASFDKS